MTAARGYLVSWRVALRIARRTALRNRARSLLVLAMIALPVYAGTLIAVTVRTTAVPWQTQARWHLGHADARLTVPGSAAGSQPRLDLPAGSRVLRIRQWPSVPVDAPAGTGSVASFAIDLADPMVAGLFRTHAGRAPRGAGEVALSAPLAAQLGAGPGDTVTVGRPARKRRVVAVLDNPANLSERFVLTGPDAPVAGRTGDGSVDLLVDLPGHPDPARMSGVSARISAGCRCGAVVNTRESFRPVSRPVNLQDIGPGVLIVGFAVVEVALLAGAAFAVGARRQTRELGLLAAAGANSRQVARVVLGGGVVLGTVAGLVGAVAGAATVAAGRPVVQRLANHVVDHTVVRFWEVAGIAALGVLAGLAAAVLPARGAARQPVLATLTGRWAGTGGGRRLVFAGVGTAALGVAVTALGAAPPSRIEFVTAGSALGLVGIVLCAPALVGLAARAARWLPLSARLALRDGGRHRNRTGAAVAAVTAAVAGSMALNLYLASQDDQQARQPTGIRLGQVWIGGDQTEVGRLTESGLAPVARTLPVRDTVLVRGAVGPTVDGEPAPVSVNRPSFGWVAVGDARLVRAIIHRAVPAAASAALASGGAVVVQPGVGIRDGTVTLSVPEPGRPAEQPTLPAVTAGAGRVYSNLPSVVIDAPTARRLGLRAEPSFVLLDTTRVPTPGEERAARRAFDGLTARLGLGGYAGISVERGYSGNLGATLLGLIGTSGLVTLVATGIAVGLAIAESRDDLSTLAAVGAAPRVRRVLSLAQAGVIAGLGTLLGLLGGILPAAGVIGMDADLRFVLPWRYIGLFAVVPVLVSLLSGAVTRSRLTLVRRLT